MKFLNFLFSQKIWFVDLYYTIWFSERWCFIYLKYHGWKFVDLIKVYLHFLEICNSLGQIKSNVVSPTTGNETFGFRWISTKSWNFPLLDSSEARAAQLWASPPRQVSGGELVAAAAVAIAGRLVGQRGELVAESGPAPPAAEEKPPVGCLLSNLQVNNHQAASQPLQEKSSAKDIKEKKKSLTEA